MIDLPMGVRSQFDGRELDQKVGAAAMLSTVDIDGWPHLSFLSAGEVLAAGGRLALTLWGAAHSTRALTERRRGVLFAAADGVVHEIRFEVVDLEQRSEAGHALVLARADALREHKAPYARVEGLIDFILDDPVAAVTRWEGQVAAMRTALDALPGVAAD